MRLLSVVVLLAGALCVSAQSLDLRSYRDETYAVKATLGTAAKGQPNQQFYLSVDALGSETKVAGVDCWQCCDKAQYDVSLSKGTCTANKDADDGTKTDACTDTFQTPAVTVAAAQFTEIVSSPLGSAFLSLPSDGVVGLSSAVYGYYFARTCSNDAAKGGTLTLNAWDTTNCNTVAPAILTTLALTTDGNKLLSTPLTKFQVDTEVPAPTGGWLATFSTTSTNLVIPQDQFNTINAILKAPKDASGNYNTFDCANLPAAAKLIKFSFTPVPGTGGAAATPQDLSIDIEQLVFRTDDNVCALRVQPQPAADTAKQNYFDFGLPLFRTYCSLVNIAGATKTIQFAPTKVAANNACTYNKLTALPACNEPTTTSSTVTTISPNATQAPAQTTTPKGASRVQVMSVLSVFVMFALSALF